jgi:hypothetical protein
MSRSTQWTYNMVCFSIIFFAVALDLLLPSLYISHHDLRADNFDSIYRKCVQYFYVQINLLKTRFKYLSNDTNYIS